MMQEIAGNELDQAGMPVLLGLETGTTQHQESVFLGFYVFTGMGTVIVEWTNSASNWGADL